LTSSEADIFFTYGHCEDPFNLIAKLAPYMSSQATKFWIERIPMLERRGIYQTGNYHYILMLTRNLISFLGGSRLEASPLKGDITYPIHARIVERSIFFIMSCLPKWFWWMTLGIPEAQFQRGTRNNQTVYQYCLICARSFCRYLLSEEKSLDSAPLSQSKNCYLQIFTTRNFGENSFPKPPILDFPENPSCGNIISVNDYYLNAARKQVSNKWICSDHLDWLNESQVQEYVNLALEQSAQN
jgi:hypothetical protein